MTDEQLLERISFNPEVMGGKPVIKGTRLTVEYIVNLLAHGADVEEVLVLVDECTGPVVASWLRAKQHEVFSVYDEARGMHDDDIIKKAADESWVLITNDKDFGQEVYRQRRPHRGVV